MKTINLPSSGAKLKSLAFGAIAGVLVATVGLVASSAHAQSSGRDWDANAVITGGCLTVNECQQKYHNPGVAQIYQWFGINSQDIIRLDSTAATCQVTKNNTVLMNGKVIATNALTGGRQNMPGSRTVTNMGVTFYVRPPSVSFVSNRLPAFCVTKNHQFDFAIIQPCGNAVVATPVPVPTPKPKPKSPPPAAPVIPPAPPTQTQTQVQSQTVVVNQPVAATTTPAKQIPNTGPGSVLGLGALATVGGTLAHSVYLRRRAL